LEQHLQPTVVRPLAGLTDEGVLQDLARTTVDGVVEREPRLTVVQVLQTTRVHSFQLTIGTPSHHLILRLPQPRKQRVVDAHVLQGSIGSLAIPQELHTLGDQHFREASLLRCQYRALSREDAVGVGSALGQSGQEARALGAVQRRLRVQRVEHMQVVTRKAEAASTDELEAAEDAVLRVFATEQLADFGAHAGSNADGFRHTGSTHSRETVGVLRRLVDARAAQLDSRGQQSSIRQNGRVAGADHSASELRHDLIESTQLHVVRSRSLHGLAQHRDTRIAHDAVLRQSDVTSHTARVLAVVVHHPVVQVIHQAELALGILVLAGNVQGDTALGVLRTATRVAAHHLLDFLLVERQRAQGVPQRVGLVVGEQVVRRAVHARSPFLDPLQILDAEVFEELIPVQLAHHIELVTQRLPDALTTHAPSRSDLTAQPSTGLVTGHVTIGQAGRTHRTNSTLLGSHPVVAFVQNLRHLLDGLVGVGNLAAHVHGLAVQLHLVLELAPHLPAGGEVLDCTRLPHVGTPQPVG